MSVVLIKNDDDDAPSWNSIYNSVEEYNFTAVFSYEANAKHK